MYTAPRFETTGLCEPPTEYESEVPPPTTDLSKSVLRIVGWRGGAWRDDDREVG
jgi:hypothetical protein